MRQSRSGRAPPGTNLVRFSHVTFDDSGAIFAAATQQGSIYAFDLQRNKFWLVHRTGTPCTAIAFGSREVSEVLTGHSDNTFRCFDTNTGTEAYVIPLPPLLFAYIFAYILVWRPPSLPLPSLPFPSQSLLLSTHVFEYYQLNATCDLLLVTFRLLALPSSSSSSPPPPPPPPPPRPFMYSFTNAKVWI